VLNTVQEVAVRRLFVVLGAAALIALPGGPALAEEPLRLDEQVVDEAGVVDDEAGIEAAVDELESEDGTQLFVVFVDTFDGLKAGEWLDSTRGRGPGLCLHPAGGLRALGGRGESAGRAGRRAGVHRG
jgi:hypothetical protein